MAMYKSSSFQCWSGRAAWILFPKVHHPDINPSPLSASEDADTLFPAYQDDLPFLSFENSTFDGEGNLDVFKLMVGARWLDDIVANNRLNEEET